MVNMMPIISALELGRQLGRPDLVIVDAQSGTDSKSKFLKQHLREARHVDLDIDLSEKPFNPAEGGRHPLPDIKKFAALVGNLGIDAASYVVVYDDKRGVIAASRFWWMLRAAGHKQVRVLDGGLQAAVAAGLPVTDEAPSPMIKPPYPVNEWKLPVVNLETVKNVFANPEFLLIDVREEYRYRGESEPLDLVAGHIPNSVNVPFKKNLNDNGTFLSSEDLAALYKQVMGERKPENVMISCGSGVTACHTLLALELAGITGASLYVGSWSEWSRNQLPIATGE
jgi:thiosulfate/3-mercaptopyruvate sulfurtransferase